MSDQPLVSCIMPTFQRRAFIPNAIRYFLRQDYDAKELIVVDDGDDSVEDLIPNDSRIRYVRLRQKMKLGAKRNFACNEALGEVIAHWDDDDWYAPHRLTAQVKLLQHHNAEVCGSPELFFYDVDQRLAWLYAYPNNAKPWFAGQSLCYRKTFWEQNRFAQIDIGEDACFMWTARPKRLAVVSERDLLVGIIHGGNTSPKETEGECWQPAAVEEIENVVGTDWKSYAPAKTSVTVSWSQTPNQPKARNVYACLVHERQECILDLVRNLRYHDPTSEILLYNGSRNPNLLAPTSFFENIGAVVHQTPRPQKWGWLHHFAFDCLQFAVDNYSFDTLTIVDSDQLLIRSGYTTLLHEKLSANRSAGMLGNSDAPQPRETQIAPVVQAWKEFELWKPFLDQFPHGREKFPHWIFWPSTVFAADAARDLLSLFKTNHKLKDILDRSNIWATEEVILPTLVSLLGYEIDLSPCSYDYVRYKVDYTLPQIETALSRDDVFWIHPVPRKFDAPIRKLIRERFAFYETAQQSPVHVERTKHDDLLLTLPLFERMRRIEGWLDDAEADLLIAITTKAVHEFSSAHAIVEVGSYCGKATVVMGTVAGFHAPDIMIYAIDPHDGRAGAMDQNLTIRSSTLADFNRNIAEATLGNVNAIQGRSDEVRWDQPISLLLIDGLHDYANVSRDFFHFEKWVANNAYVAFHDYADYFPGVKAFVDELLRSGQYRKVCLVKSMMVLQKSTSRI